MLKMREDREKAKRRTAEKWAGLLPTWRLSELIANRGLLDLVFQSPKEGYYQSRALRDTVEEDAYIADSIDDFLNNFTNC